MRRYSIKMKTCLVFLAVLSMAIFTGCNGDEKMKEYYRVDYQEGTISIANSAPNPFAESTKVIASLEELTDANIENNYTDDFFESKSIILVQFIHPSSETNITFHEFVTDNEKLYFIFKIDSQEIHTDDLVYGLYSLEVSNETVASYDIGDILVINNTFQNQGSVHFSKFDGIIKSE